MTEIWKVWGVCSKCHEQIGGESIGDVNQRAREQGWEVIGEFRTENGMVGGCKTLLCPDCRGGTSG